VTVNLSVPADKPLTGGQFNLSWDANVLEMTGITNGTFFSTANCPVTPVPFFLPPTIDNSLGRMTNFAFAGLGIPVGEGCTGEGTVVTLNFRAKATGRSTNVVSGVILSDGNAAAYPEGTYSFPGFTQFIGQKLVVTNFELLPAGLPQESSFFARVTVTNEGSVDSVADSFELITDGKATPATKTGNIPVIPAGQSTSVEVSGFDLLETENSSLVTLNFADQSIQQTHTRRYVVYLPSVIR
ncbi:MAG: cohesin domain-containing protein, partial [Chloroflexota bacterium]